MMLIYFVIALVCIGFILSPAKTIMRITEYNGDIYEIQTNNSALSFLGMAERAESWKEYPAYNIGFGIIAILSFSGGLYSIANMYKLKEATACKRGYYLSRG